MTGAAGATERERLARILYGIAGGSDRSDTWGTDNAAPDDVKHAYFDADTLMLAGFGDVEQMRAERDAALAVAETPEQIRDRLLPVVLSYAAAEGLSELGKVQAALRLGAQAGIQSAQGATS